MKRYGQLWEQVISWENLVLAARKAQRGKRHRDSVIRFNFGQERELLRLQGQLACWQYCPGAFTCHWIYERKARLISAAPYRDRVVHHALMNILEPILDKHFHPHSYACRKGKGTHAAANRLQHLMQGHRYALQCDIRKFFPSIDYSALKQAFRRLIKDRQVLWLMDLIVDHSNEQEAVLDWFAGDDLFAPLEHRRGLPIGNLTSQWFANWMLDGLDHYITSGLGLGAYVRYCDDFLVLDDDKARLREAAGQIGEFLARLRLRLHEGKLFVRPVRAGLTFVGYRIWPTHRILRKDNIHRFRRRVWWMRQAYAAGLTDWPRVKLRLDSWIAHAHHTDCKLLIGRLSRQWVFQRGTAANVPCSARRQLEQQRQQLPRGEPQQQQARQSQQQHRVPCCPALSLAEGESTRNCTVYGSCERGLESPGCVPEPHFVETRACGRMYVVRPDGSGRFAAEGPIRSLLLKCREAA